MNIRQKRFVFGGGAFSPLILSPALWLKDTGTFQERTGASATTPADGDGEVVGSWLDQSGNGNHVVAAADTNRPTLQVAEQNGRNVVRFDGVDNFLQSGAFTLVQPEHVFIVYKSIVIGAEAVSDSIFDGRTGFSMLLASDTGPVTRIFNGVASPAFAANVCNGAFGLITCLFNSAGGATASYIRENGTEKATGDPTNAANASGFTIGSSGSSNRFTNIDVAEVLIYPGVLTTGQQTQVETYLRGRWGTP
jgi:hypothetical protein